MNFGETNNNDINFKSKKRKSQSQSQGIDEKNELKSSLNKDFLNLFAKK